MEDTTEAFMVGLLPLFEKLLYLDNNVTSFNQNISLLMKNMLNIVGSTVEGSWSSHLLPEHLIEFEIDLMILQGVITSEVLEKVPNRVDHFLINRKHFDSVKFRWIEEYHNKRRQSRSYMLSGRCNMNEFYESNIFRFIDKTVNKRIQTIFDRLYSRAMESNGSTEPSTNGVGAFILEIVIHIAYIYLTWNESTRISDDLGSYFLKIKFNRWVCICLKHWMKGPAKSFTLGWLLHLSDIHSLSDVHICVSLDMVHALELEDWPPATKQHKKSWLDRKRFWPDRRILQIAARQKCHLVSKPLRQGRLDLGHDWCEWRLSFIKAEQVLAMARSNPQKLVYIMAKVIFYIHLQTMEDEETQLSSYMLKTCMMWKLEETPTEQWSTGNVVPLLKDLLEKLASALVSGTLPHYFLPEINILSDVPEHTLYTRGVRLREISNKCMGVLQSTKQRLIDILDLVDFAATESFAKRMERCRGEETPAVGRVWTAAMMHVGAWAELGQMVKMGFTSAQPTEGNVEETKTNGVQETPTELFDSFLECLNAVFELMNLCRVAGGILKKILLE